MDKSEINLKIILHVKALILHESDLAINSVKNSTSK